MKYQKCKCTSCQLRKMDFLFYPNIEMDFLLKTDILDIKLIALYLITRLNNNMNLTRKNN